MLSLNGMPVGFIPQHGITNTPMTAINSVMTGASLAKSATYGYYAQTYAGMEWDGQQFMKILDDIKASGAIFEAAVMPVESWRGYSATDNSQAIAVAKIMRKITDEGVDVRLRFAHEANYYTTTTAKASGGAYYAGGADAMQTFKVAFKEVAQACAKYAPSVEMVYSPNMANLTELKAWAPSTSLFKYVAVDYYPETQSELSVDSFVSKVKPFHDYFTADSDRKFIIAESGLHINTTKSARLQWLEILTSEAVQTALPNLISVTWFNLNLESATGGDFDYRIMDWRASKAYNAPLLSMLEDARPASSTRRSSTSSTTKKTPSKTSATHSKSHATALKGDASTSKGRGNKSKVKACKAASSETNSAQPTSSEASADHLTLTEAQVSQSMSSMAIVRDIGHRGKRAHGRLHDAIKKVLT
ncbi:hypothetical protein BCV69DRAFT_314780 [Microstroma glucosiphilum]|uniref:Glycoside hydrolase n=1 Tax=Pseudomicrostroma glucosiphilum TaxID=1684307 RepID=A0A316TY59_9BASI|nr:hypothetical protein BCV69DRAFT_314780 [Pseudomicrostroma glucosiphilum]PWN18249.1 hypothetical protein BCV69DRAFT_314780 [Pseudomicrostroma glucosiphilum]